MITEKNVPLKKLVAELDLDRAVLKDVDGRNSDRPIDRLD